MPTHGARLPIIDTRAPSFSYAPAPIAALCESLRYSNNSFGYATHSINYQQSHLLLIPQRPSNYKGRCLAMRTIGLLSFFVVICNYWLNYSLSTISKHAVFYLLTNPLSRSCDTLIIKSPICSNVLMISIK